MPRASLSTASAVERRRGTDRSKWVFRMSGSPRSEAVAASVVLSPMRIRRISPEKSETTPATRASISLKVKCQSRRRGAK